MGAEEAPGNTPADPDREPAGDGDLAGRGRPDQPTLPFEEAEDPIPFALTARARRTVAPASLPDLSVVSEADVAPAPAGEPPVGPSQAPWPDRVDDPDPFDPRPARARALLRAGREVSEIAGLLEVGEELVARWCRTVGPRADRRRARSAGHRSGGAQVRRLPLPEPDRHEPQRRHGHDQALEHLDGDTAEVLAFVAGGAQVTAHSVTFHVAGPDLAARIVSWLAGFAGADPHRARLVLEVGPSVAHDLVEARWEQGTGIPAEHITVSRGAVDSEVHATLRIADPDVAAIVAGWQDAIMEMTAPSTPDA